MASRPEFVQYIADQLTGAGTITYRKMFGEYGIYCDGKIFGVICDDQFFVKVTEAGKRLGPDLETAAGRIWRQRPPMKAPNPIFSLKM